MRGLSTERLRPALFWLVALAAVAALRLPYLSSPVYILDNDEAVLGIMARHVAAGREIPLYFAGQSYGLSVFETLPAAAAFKAFGDTAHVLALTMLALYLLGLLAYASAFRRLSGSEPWARALTIGFAVVPGWVVWSMKARGLYVSGFLLTGCALAILTRPALSRGSVAAVGVLLGLIGLVQPLWLAVSAPLLFLERRRLRDVAMAGGLAALVWLVPLVFGSAGDAYWRPPPLAGIDLRLGFVPVVFSRAFSGDVTPAVPGPIAVFLGGVGTAAFFVLAVAAAVDAVRRRSRAALCVCAAMLLSLAHVVLLHASNPRYFLPATVLLFVALAVWIRERDLPARGAAMLAAAGTIALMAVAATRLGRVGVEPALAAAPAEADLRTLIAGLEADGVRGVYSPTGDIRWQILFYDRERIPARGRSAVDRYPELPRAVEDARVSGEKTALVADLRQLRRALPELRRFPGYRVGERYLRLDDPGLLELALLGIDLTFDSSGASGTAPSR